MKVHLWVAGTMLLLAIGVEMPPSVGQQHRYPVKAVAPTASNDNPYLLTLEGPGNEKGAWYVPPLPPLSDRMQAVHIVLLPDGNVLIVNGSSNRNRIVDGKLFDGVNTNDYNVVNNSAIFMPSAPLGTPGLRRIPSPPTPGPDGESVDLFCSGHIQLPDGNVLFAGGTREYIPGDWFYGSRTARIFDWHTESWRVAGKLHAGHWYPAVGSLADGRVFVLSGLGYDSWTNTPWLEIYDPSEPADSRWTAVDTSKLPNSPFNTPISPNGPIDVLPHYPRLGFLADGRVYITGDGSGAGNEESRNTYFMEIGPPRHDKQAPTVNFTLGPPRPEPRRTYNSVFPDPTRNDGTFLLMGGMVHSDNFNYGPPFVPPSPEIKTIATLERFTPSPGSGQWSTYQEFLGEGPTAPRIMHVGILLPSGQILIMGGGNYGYYDSVTRPQLLSPDPKAEGGFRVDVMNPATQPRFYHNNALLLPDGRVLAAGGNVFRAARDVNTGEVRLDTWQRNDGGYQFAEQGVGLTPPAEIWQMEIFYPPYLFLPGPRPVIESVPTSANYGKTVKIRVQNATANGSVVLMKLGSATHGWDMGQRFVKLTITNAVAAREFQVTMPTNANLYPPGYYMLFYLNDLGKPSVAAMVQLGIKGGGDSWH
jgi:galactose oxidase-like protein